MFEAITDLENGLFAANLGGNLYKLRVKRTGRGKNSGPKTSFTKKELDLLGVEIPEVQLKGA